MNTRIVVAIGVALLSFAASLPARAQNTSGFVVSVCGSPPHPFIAGHLAPITIDVNGTLCSVAGGGGGGGAVTNAGTFAVQNTAATPAGSAIIGKVGIDQTTPGTTNAVSATNFPSTVATGTGAQGATVPRVTIATDSATVGGSASIPAGTNVIGGTAGSYFTNVAGSTLTRIANVTAYAANQTVCLFTSVTVCAPGTISIATANAGKGLINRVSLLKSGSSTTNATFTIWLFSAAPVTATPSQFDATSYTGPRAADMPNYIGSATCTSPVVTSDTTTQVWYDCALSNPNTGGALDFQALSGSTNINYLISVTAAYTPASGETFIPYVSGIY